MLFRSRRRPPRSPVAPNGSFLTSSRNFCRRRGIWCFFACLKQGLWCRHRQNPRSEQSTAETICFEKHQTGPMEQKMLPACRKWDVWCLNLLFDPEVWAAAMPGAGESAAAAMPGAGGSVAASMSNVSESAIVARQNAGEEGAGLLQCRVPARIGVLQCRTPPRSAGAFSRRGSSSELTGGPGGRRVRSRGGWF